MSGPRITRKVTVEVSKKVTEVGSVPSSVVQPSSSSSSYNPRRSVFERLGPGAVDRSKTRESYPPDKCRNWLRDGRCPYGNNCKFLHGPYSDQKPRSKSVRSIVSSGSKDRHEDSDEKTQTYHSRSQDSIEYDEEDEEQEQIKKKKRHKSEEDLSDSATKKTTKSKKKHKEETDAEDEDRKAKRKRKTHKKRDSSPKSKHRSPKEDEKDWDTKASLLKDFEQQMKDAENWEDQGGELDYDRQLELERRRQDLQRQLALMDEEDAAASAEDTVHFKENEKEEEPKKVPIVHSRLHPEPSAGTPSDDGTVPQLTTTKKKKKKKLDSEGEGTKTKKKKEASPRKKDESKRKVVARSDEDVPVIKEISPNPEIVKKESTGYVGSSDDTELLEHHKTKKKVRKTSKSSGVRGREKHTPEPYPEASPPRERVEQPVRKRPEEEEYRRQGGLSPQLKPTREKRKSESDDLVTRRTEEGRSRKSRDTAEYYPSPDEHEDNRKVRSKVVGHARISLSNERQRAEEERSDGRAGRRETEERVTSRGPRSPSSPGHVKREDERYVYEDAAEEPKRKRPTRARSPVREPAREDAGYKKEGTDRDRGRHEDPHGRGPRTPPDNEDHFSPPPNQAEATRSNRFSEREKDLPRRERDMSRERGQPNDQGDPRYPDRGGRVHPDSDFERRRPRDEEVSRSRRQPLKPEEYPRGRPQDDDHPRYRGRDEDFPKDTRDVEFLRHREGREGRDDDFQRPKYREDKPEEYPPRSRARGERDEGEFVRGRGRDDRGDEGRGRPPPRDVQRRLHDELEGNERDLRDERGRARPEGYIDSRSRERPDDRARDPRYTPEHFRRPSPSQGPPRGRSPPHRYDDRRRIDDGYRGGPGSRDAPVGRGRGYADRGRGEYSSPYDSRGRAMDTRRRTPPLGPRSSFQDRDRGPPRGRDMPAGRERGYADKTRPPPSDRYRDTGAPWERRADRDYRDHRKPFVEPGIRDRHPRDSSPPQQGFRDQRPWEERDRRGSPLRGGNIPPQERRPPFDAEHDVRGRPEPRERRSLEPRGPEGWEYGEDVNKRKRPRPTTAVSSRPGSPFESKKLREQSPADFNADPSLADIPAAPEEPIRTKKTAVTTKKIKKKKLGKKEGKTAKVGVVSDGSIEPTAGGVEEGKIIKVEKKQKKEKKMKGGKKKKKVVVAAVALGDTVTATAAVEEPGMAKQVAPETTKATAAPKLGKKRKQAVALEGEQPVENDAEKPKKKKKKKYQPEVVVQPWADLEEEDEVTMEEKKVQEDKETKEDDQDREDKPLTTEKSADEMFSDWSDGDSPLGDDNWIDENEQMSPSEKKIDDDVSSAPAAPAKSSPSSEDRGPSFDDVYDPISDDEFEAMYTQSDEEEEKKEQKGSNKGLGIEEVDWSSLGISLQPEKEKEPGSHLEKFTPGQVFSRIGISPNLAGQRLTQLVQEACAKNKTDTTNKQETGNELSIPEEGPKCIGAFVAAAAAKRREREALVGNLGPCRRALCARRDLSIRKQLGRSSKFDKVALFAASQSTPVGPPVDNELFQMSVALYNKDSTNTEISTRVIPSKVGSILLTQA